MDDTSTPTHRIQCTHTISGDTVNGVRFENDNKRGGSLSEPVTKDVADGFASIPGYKAVPIAGAAPQPQGGGGSDGGKKDGEDEKSADELAAEARKKEEEEREKLHKKTAGPLGRAPVTSVAPNADGSTPFQPGAETHADDPDKAAALAQARAMDEELRIRSAAPHIDIEKEAALASGALDLPTDRGMILANIETHEAAEAGAAIGQYGTETVARPNPAAELAVDNAKAGDLPVEANTPAGKKSSAHRATK